MKIVFLQQLWYEWQAPMIFSSIAKKKKHDTAMYIKTSPVKAAQKAISEKADLIVFSSITSGNMQFVYECAARIKQRKDIPILIGGVYVSLYYEKISMQNIDFLGIGEGEYTFSLLLDAIENKTYYGDIPGLGYQRHKKLIVNQPQSVCNLDEIPSMDRMLYYKYQLLRREKVRMFYSGRGCKYECSYCCVPILLELDATAAKVRKKSPEAMIIEIQEVQDKFGLKAAFFQDDTFTQDRVWLLKFLELYKRNINKPLMCMSRAINIDEEIADALAANGCVSVGIGLETANENTREKLNRKETNNHIRNAILLLRERGIKVTTFNMLGIPDESMRDIMKTIIFNHENRVESSWGVLYQPYVKDKVINCCQEDNGNFYTKLGYDCPDKKHIEQIQKLYPLLVRWPGLQRTILHFMPDFLAYFIFAFNSFFREIFIWKRSFILTLIVGVKNQILYKKNK